SVTLPQSLPHGRLAGTARHWRLAGFRQRATALGEFFRTRSWATRPQTPVGECACRALVACARRQTALVPARHWHRPLGEESGRPWAPRGVQGLGWVPPPPPSPPHAPSAHSPARTG